MLVIILLDMWPSLKQKKVFNMLKLIDSSQIKLIFFGIIVLSAHINAAAQWRYRAINDEMRGSKVQFAELKSSNRAELDFPYRGGSSLEINIRKRNSEEESDVFLWIDRGQIPCHSECVIYTKFDEDEVKSWSGSGPVSYKSNMIFIENSTEFIERIKTSKKLILEVKIFDYGGFQYKFNTGGLRCR